MKAVAAVHRFASGRAGCGHVGGASGRVALTKDLIEATRNIELRRLRQPASKCFFRQPVRGALINGTTYVMYGLGVTLVAFVVGRWSR